MRYKLLIFLILLTGVLAIASVIMIGMARRDLIVEEHPYEAGLEFDNRLKRYAELGWDIESLYIKDNMLVMRIIDKHQRPIENALVNSIVNRCADNHTTNYGCINRGNGYYHARIDTKDAGCIEVKVNVIYKGNMMSFDRTINIEKRQRGGDQNVR